jgi:hypothetical protein
MTASWRSSCGGCNAGNRGGSPTGIGWRSLFEVEVEDDLSGDEAMRSQDMTDEEIARRGQEIYDSQLRAMLEPGLNGSEIAICVEDGDYEVSDTMPDADARLRQRHPDAVFFYGRVGGEHAVYWATGHPDVLAGKY